MDPDTAVTVRIFPNRVLAELALTALAAKGVKATISADDCGGARPELQFSSGVRIMVDARDRKRAELVLKRFDESRAEAGWEEEDDLEDLGSGTESEAHFRARSRLRSRVPSGLLWFIAGAVVASLIWGGHMYRERHRSEIYTADFNHDGAWDARWIYEDGHAVKHERDRNADGVADVEAIYEGGMVVRGEADENFDHASDSWQYYEDDDIVSSEDDKNFDGEVDARYRYENGVLRSSEHDWDFNGEFDAYTDYRNGVTLSVQIKPNGSDVALIRQRYYDGVLRTEWLDTDLDGTFDLERTYSPMGLVIEEKAI